MDQNSNAIPPPLPEEGKHAPTRPRRGPRLWQILACFAPTIVLAATFMLSGARSNKSQIPLFIGTIIWCAGFAFPLTASVRTAAGRVVLYLVLFPGLVMVNLATGFFVGCCLLIFKGH